MKTSSIALILLLFLIPNANAQFWVPCYATPDSGFNLAHYSRHECGAVTAHIDGHRLAILLGGRSGSGQPDKKRPILTPTASPWAMTSTSSFTTSRELSGGIPSWWLA
jgi:hypothetical protein